MPIPFFEEAVFNDQFRILRGLNEHDDGIWPSEGLVAGRFERSGLRPVSLPMVVRWAEQPPSITTVTFWQRAEVLAHVVHFAVDRGTISVHHDTTAHEPAILDMVPSEQFRLATEGARLRVHPLGLQELRSFVINFIQNA